MILSIPPISDGQLALWGFGVVGLYLLCHLGKRLIDLWIDSMGHQSTLDQHAVAALRLARKEPAPYVGFDPPEVAPEDEPSWEGKAPHDSGVRPLVGVLNDGFDNPYPATAGTPPETPAETSGRHALTESMPAVVVDDEALAVVAAVSGQDGA